METRTIEELKKELAELKAQLAAKQAPKKAKLKNGERHIPMGASGKHLKTMSEIPPEELRVLLEKQMANLANQALAYENQAVKFQKMADLCYEKAKQIQQRLA